MKRLVLLCAFIAMQVQALPSGYSRACQFSTLDPARQNLAVIMAIYMGGDPQVISFGVWNQKLCVGDVCMDNPPASQEYLSHWWDLHSTTVSRDDFIAYPLFAISDQKRNMPFYRSTWWTWRELTSGDWARNSFGPNVQYTIEQDARFIAAGECGECIAAYWSWSTARAGSPLIWEELRDPGPRQGCQGPLMNGTYWQTECDPVYPDPRFVVHGIHWYWDPEKHTIVRMQDSTAHDCNVDVWSLAIVG